MKINEQNVLHGSRAMELCLDEREILFFVRRFEIRIELLPSRIELLFSDECFETYNFAPSYLLEFLEFLKN
jgi:hypothetical protein